MENSSPLLLSEINIAQCFINIQIYIKDNQITEINQSAGGNVNTMSGNDVTHTQGGEG